MNCCVYFLAGGFDLEKYLSEEQALQYPWSNSRTTTKYIVVILKLWASRICFQSHPTGDRFEICPLSLTDEFMGVLNLMLSHR